MVNLCPFGTFYGNLVYFSRFGMLYRDKSGNPGRENGVELVNLAVSAQQVNRIA
jgi:polyferredoxin